MTTTTSPTLNKSPDKQSEYETIESIIKTYKQKSLEKINVYGILTFIYTKPSATANSSKSTIFLIDLTL